MLCAPALTGCPCVPCKVHSVPFQVVSRGTGTTSQICPVFLQYTPGTKTPTVMFLAPTSKTASSSAPSGSSGSAKVPPKLRECPGATVNSASVRGRELACSLGNHGRALRTCSISSHFAGFFIPSPAESPSQVKGKNWDLLAYTDSAGERKVAEVT